VFSFDERDGFEDTVTCGLMCGDTNPQVLKFHMLSVTEVERNTAAELAEASLLRRVHDVE